MTGDFIVANPNLNKDNAIYYSRVDKFSNVDVDFRLVSSLPSDSDGNEDENDDSSDEDEPTDGGSGSSGNCVQDVSITNDVTSATTKQAESTLTANNTVDHSSGTVKYRAGDKLILEDGFSVEVVGNEVFKAVLEDCQASSSSTAKVVALKAGFYHNWNPETDEAEETETSDGPILYPNPTISVSALQFTLGTDDYISIDIYDINNQIVQSVVREQKMFEGQQEVEIDMTSLVSGLYFISIEGQVEKKIVKAVKR